MKHAMPPEMRQRDSHNYLMHTYQRLEIRRSGVWIGDKLCVIVHWVPPYHLLSLELFFNNKLRIDVVKIPYGYIEHISVHDTELYSDVGHHHVLVWGYSQPCTPTVGRSSTMSSISSESDCDMPAASDILAISSADDDNMVVG